VILGLGIDLVEVSRLEREVARHGDGVIIALFSPPEIAACRRARRPFPAYAIRFAAKEAFLKALGTGLSGRLSWHDIEVVEEQGSQAVRLSGGAREAAGRAGVQRIHLSTAHTGSRAFACVVVEGAEVDGNRESGAREGVYA
jgi:holo-[acyl-carrier protein] synthase